MPFDWNNYLTLAEDLATRTDEASKRTAISRAYYCVFNLAYARAESSAGHKPDRESYHNWCWNKYKNTPDKLCKQLGVNGDRMKSRRVNADYKPTDNPRLDDEVQRMLEDARQFVRELASLQPTYPLP